MCIKKQTQTLQLGKIILPIVYLQTN
jgi:hypothetical protein